ncbi:MAG: hypothetical protein IKJ78_00350 [Bacteroidales bacterium]|nr:hypothetical protein [Bacteroidales bacterium]
MKKVTLFWGVLIAFCMLSCNNNPQEKEVAKNSQKNEAEMVTAQITTNVPSHVRFGWEVIKRTYTDVKSCTAYCVNMVNEQMYNGALHTFYVVIYEIHAADLSLGAKCLAVSFCPDFDYSGSTSIYCNGTLEENKQALLGDIVKVNLK